MVGGGQQGWGAAVQGSYGHYNTTVISGTGSCGVQPVSPSTSTTPITATFTWTHGTGQNDQNDPPPAVVLLEETCDTAWQSSQSSAQAGYSIGGNYSNPLGGTVTGDGVFSGDQSGIRYSVQGGGTLTTSVSPTASFSGSGSAPAMGTYSASAHVSYTLRVVAPITITLGGTLTDSSGNPVLDGNGNQQALTGQQIMATLNGIPSNYTVTKYTWAVGGNTFKNYDPTLPSNQLVPLGSADLTGPAVGSNTVAPLAFYDSTQENLTVTCTVTMMTPDGTTLNFTASSPPVMVEKPTVSKWDIYTGYVQDVTDVSSGQSGDALKNAPGSTQAGGEAWSNTTIVVPAPFTATGGSGCFAQLVTPDVEISNADLTKDPTIPNNKQQGLDNSFPYKGYKWDVSVLGANFDGPAVLFKNYNVTNGSGYTQVLTNQDFTTWVMYQPPGGVWVPLQSYTWNWSFTSQWNVSLNQWELFRANRPKRQAIQATKAQIRLSHRSGA
jgi:hypothetical protein